MDESLKTYKCILDETDTLSKSLLNNFEEIVKELKEERELRMQAEKKMLLFMEFSLVNINRYTFRNLFKSLKNRNETDYEWHLFIKTFKYDCKGLNDKILKWINGGSS